MAERLLRTSLLAARGGEQSLATAQRVDALNLVFERMRGELGGRVSARALSQLACAAVLLYCGDAGGVERAAPAAAEQLAALTGAILDRAADVLLDARLCPPTLPVTLVCLLLSVSRTTAGHAGDLARVRAAAALQRPAYAAIAHAVSTHGGAGVGVVAERALREADKDGGPVHEARPPGHSPPWLVLTEEGFWMGLGVSVALCAVGIGVVVDPHTVAPLLLPLPAPMRARLVSLLGEGRTPSLRLPRLTPALASLLARTPPWVGPACATLLALLLLPALGVLALTWLQERPGRHARSRIVAFLLGQPDLRAFMRVDRVLASAGWVGEEEGEEVDVDDVLLAHAFGD